MGTPLFVAYTGATWSSQSIRKAVQRHRQTAGLPRLANDQHTHMRHWPKTERERFVATPVEPYDRSIEQAQLVIALGLYCGLRREEMRTLKAEDIDLFQKKAHVLGKGKKRRDVPLNGHVLSLLDPVVRARQPGQTVLIDEDGGPLAEKRINGIVSVLAERAGITYKDVTPHTLRHSFGTLLNERKAEAATIKELMGHSRLEETFRYIHPAARSMRDAVERLVPGYNSDVKVPS
ncbi:MAG: tyrosine-type recombinase/integrase [Anaerolineae bacterium]|nr:tyrosine-type recombinase/integrase [Anaerolineae bacterium]